jgi:hypothetical protein
MTCVIASLIATTAAAQIGSEKAVPNHLADGAEFTTPLSTFLGHGARVFNANWTADDGQGRPSRKGNGNPLSDPNDPLVFPRNFNRVSAPDANSCAGCHNLPRSGGGGDIVANVFVLGQRFDFATFGDVPDGFVTKGTTDEQGKRPLLQQIANSRNTLGMFGSGYIEMLARQMTTEMQAIRDGIPAGGSAALATKGVSFGTLARFGDGSWDVSGVVGLPVSSLGTTGPTDPPNLIVRPFHQAGAVISLREFSNNALNHHHGIQSTERFGAGDTDNDGVGGPTTADNEATTADVTAMAVWQATLPPPGRVIPRGTAIRAAIQNGEALFASETVGCASCHKPYLVLDAPANGTPGWFFSEPNPFNPAGNLRPGDAYVQQHGTYVVDLNSTKLPGPRLRAVGGVVRVPAFTDLKLHDIMTGDPAFHPEALRMQAPAGSPAFFAGNTQFLTRKLWGAANEPPYGVHGQYTTMRESIMHHYGEATPARLAFLALSTQDQGSIIEFLKSLQVLPQKNGNLTLKSFTRGFAGGNLNTTTLAVDDLGNPVAWPDVIGG